MSKRRGVFVILFITLVVAAQAVITQPYFKDIIRAEVSYWIFPGVVGLLSVLTGVLLHSVFVVKNKRLSLPAFLLLGVISLSIAFIDYIWPILSFLPATWMISLMQEDFARIVSGVFLGGLLMNRIRKDDASPCAGIGERNQKQEGGIGNG